MLVGHRFRQLSKPRIRMQELFAESSSEDFMNSYLNIFFLNRKEYRLHSQKENFSAHTPLPQQVEY